MPFVWHPSQCDPLDFAGMSLLHSELTICAERAHLRAKRSPTDIFREVK